MRKSIHEKKSDNDALNAKELQAQHLDKQGQNKQMRILDIRKKNVDPQWKIMTRAKNVRMYESFAIFADGSY